MEGIELNPVTLADGNNAVAVGSGGGNGIHRVTVSILISQL